MKKLVALVSALVLGGSLAVAALVASSAPSFARARSYATGGCCPSSVAIGDLNGDGKTDLVAANGGRPPNPTNTVSVLLNRGNGSFQAELDYPTGPNPSSVAIGDLNGDGKADVVTANGPVVGANTVSVLLNRGDGSLQAKRDYAIESGPLSVAIGDLNGDGTPDLATANDFANSVSVLLNRGDGSFEGKRDYATGLNPQSVAIGDLNGDGKSDLATANALAEGVSVLLNAGDGSFKAKRNYVTGLGPESVAIGDLNGDGKPDLASANHENSSVSVLLNRNDGTFRAARHYSTGSFPEEVAIGDLNGDGKPDLATDGGTNTISVRVNKGDGSFQAKFDYRTGRYPSSVAIGDLNGDGKPDLATANSSPSTVSVLLNTPGLCTVQSVIREKLHAAKRTIARANCRVGKIRRVYLKTVKRGRVISQKPNFGAVLRGGGTVNLVVSRGRKPS